MELSQDQGNALEAIHDWLDNEYQVPYFVLTGGGGTGKTTALGVLLEQISRSYEIWLTAPTHQAKDILVSKSPLGHYKEAKTIHGFLGLHPQPDSYGKLRLEAGMKKKFTADLVVVDEASMISGGIWEWINEESPYAETLGFSSIKWLFVGDRGQINPVGESESPIFTLNLPQYELTKVLRYGGELLELATSIRTDGLDAVKGRKSNYKNFSKFRRDFLNSAVNSTPGEVVYLAWTNNAVEEMRHELREHLYDADANEPFVAGEIIRASQDILNAQVQSDLWNSICGGKFNSPLQHEDLIARNGQLIEVLSVEVKEPEGNMPYKLNRLKLRNQSDRTKWMDFTYTLHPDSAEQFKKDQDAIAQLAKNWKLAHAEKDMKNQARAEDALRAAGYKGVSGKLSKEAWCDFFSRDRLFSKFNSPFTLSIHKSQGSTFKNVWVDLADAAKNRNEKERDRLAYTACTRSSHELQVYLP